MTTHHIDLGVGVPHIADNGAGLHFVHVLAREHVLIAGGRDEEVHAADDLVQLDDAETVHAVTSKRKRVNYVAGNWLNQYVSVSPCLEGAYRIDFRDVHDGAERLQCLATAFAHLAVAAHDDLLPAEHHVRGALQTVFIQTFNFFPFSIGFFVVPVNDRLFTRVQVVKLGLGDRVVHVHGRHAELVRFRQLVETVHAGDALFNDS